MDDADLRREVRKAARGDERAAGLLFDHYHPRLYRYALGKVGRSVDAEDVAAETFARVLRKLPSFRWRGGGFEAWIFRIASNVVVDHYRRTKEDPDERIGQMAETLDMLTPESAALSAEDAAELRTLMDQLPEEQREVLLLRFAADLDTKAAAAVLGKNANAIRQLQFRALANLRSRMTPVESQ